jgi:hypothetical protein
MEGRGMKTWLDRYVNGFTMDFHANSAKNVRGNMVSSTMAAKNFEDLFNEGTFLRVSKVT